MFNTIIKKATHHATMEYYKTLAIQRGFWERTDVRSGGLQDWALHEICAQNDRCHVDKRPLAVVQAVVAQKVARPQMERPQRLRLRHEEAVAIYLAKLGPKSCKTAARLAAEFGITAKAVRDVWTGKTWADQTRCVWTVRIRGDYTPTSLLSAAATARVGRALSRVPAPPKFKPA